MSGEPSAIAQPPPAPTPRTTGAAPTARTPPMPPLSPRGAQKRTPASVLADTPVNVTPPRKVAPIISATAPLISPPSSTATEGQGSPQNEEGDRSPMPRRPLKDGKATPTAATTPKKAAVARDAPPSATTATVVKKKNHATPPPSSPPPETTADVKRPAAEAPPATPATTTKAVTTRTPSSSSSDLVKELRRLSAGRRSNSGETEPSPGSSAPAPEPKPTLTPRQAAAAAATAATTNAEVPAVTSVTTPRTRPTPAASSPKPTTAAAAPTSVADNNNKKEATTTPTKTSAAMEKKKTTPVPSPTPAVDRRVGIQLKLEETSEERRRTRIIYDELQEYVQMRKDFRESALVLLDQGKSAQSAQERFLKREAAHGLTPHELDQLVEALGPAPGGTSRGASRATTPRAGTTARAESTHDTSTNNINTNSNNSHVPATTALVTPRRAVSPTTPVRPAATQPAATTAEAEAESAAAVKEASPVATALTSQNSLGEVSKSTVTTTTTTPTPRSHALLLPPLTPRTGNSTTMSKAATTDGSNNAPTTPSAIKTSAFTRNNNTNNHDDGKTSGVSTVTTTPQERSLASGLVTPRSRSVAAGDATDAAEQRERERELKELRRDKERLERDLSRANTKLTEAQEKLAAEKESHSTDRKEAAAKLSEVQNEAKQTQKDLRDGQRREEKLQKDLDKANENVEKAKQQMQALKEKQTTADAASAAPGAMTPSTPRAMSVSLGVNNNNNSAELRALERKVESLEKDKKRLEEGLEKMTQRQSDAATELRSTKQELQKLTSESAKEKSTLQSELKQKTRDVEKLERTVQQKTEEIAKLKEERSSASAAGGAVTPRRGVSLAQATPAAAATGSDAEQQLKTLETDLRKAQRELRQANERVKALEAQLAAEAETNKALQAHAETFAATEKQLNDTVRGLEKAIKAAEADRDGALASQKKLEASVKNLEARLTEAEKAATAQRASAAGAAEMERAVDTLKAQVQVMKDETRSATAGLAAQEKTVADLHQKLAAVEKERDAVLGVAQDAAAEAAALATQLEDMEKAMKRLKAERLQQRETSLVEAENEVDAWKRKHSALEDAVCELQAHAKQVEEEAKTLQTALDAAEQAREELSNRYASQSKRLLMQQQEQARKSASSSPARTAQAVSELETRLGELQAALATTEAALAARSQEATTLATELAHLRDATAESELTASLSKRVKHAEAALQVAQRENMEIKAVNDKVFLHLSKLEDEVESARASSASPGRHSTSSATANAAPSSHHTRELMQSQLEQEKASRRELEKEVRRLQAKLRRVEKGEAVSTTVSPNASVLVPSSPTFVSTPTRAAAEHRKEVPTGDLAQQWNRGYFTPLATLSPAKAPRAPAVEVIEAGQSEPSSEVAPRSSTWRPSHTFEEEEAELQRQQFAADHADHHQQQQQQQQQVYTMAAADAGGRRSPAGQSFSTLSSLPGAGAGWSQPQPLQQPNGAAGRRRPSRARSPQAAHCLDTRFVDPTTPPPEGFGAGSLSHLPATPQYNPSITPRLSAARAMTPSSCSLAPVALAARYATRLSPAGLVFSSTAQRLLVSGQGRRVERLLLQPTMSGSSPSSPPHKNADSASIISTSAVGSVSHSIYAARMDAEGQHWERNVFAFTVRIGDLRTLTSTTAETSRPDPLDVLVGFSDRYVPLEGFGNGRNSLRYSGCYYLHVGSGTLFAPGQNVRGAKYPGWSKAATQARALCTPPSPSLSTTATTAGSRNIYGVVLAAQPGDEITCVLHVRERCIRFEWNGVDCGVAFEEVETSPSLYPSVEMNSSGGCLELL